MTIAHYLHVCREVGFDVITVHRKITPIDIPFYLRFVDTLGRYQALDLETDFLTLVLTKGTDLSAQTNAAVAKVNYLDRQRDLDLRIGQHLAGTNASATDEPLGRQDQPEPVARSEAPIPTHHISVSPVEDLTI